MLLIPIWNIYDEVLYNEVGRLAKSLCVVTLIIWIVDQDRVLILASSKVNEGRGRSGIPGR